MPYSSIMRGLMKGTGATKRGLERSRGTRKLSRYGSALSLLGVMVVGCAAQDAGDDPPNAGSSSGGTTSTAGTASAGNANAGSTANMAGGANGGSASGGSATAGAAGNQSSSGSGGMAGASSGGHAGSGGAAGSAGAAGTGGKGGSGGVGGSAGSAGAGGKGGSGGTAGASGSAGAGGSAGTGGSAGSGGSAGGGGTGGTGGGSCSLVTDCAAQLVCEASLCRARGCNATNCAYDLTRFILGTPVAASARGQVFVTWDATKLSLDFQILDKTAQNDSANNWEDDSVEIYLDLNHAKATTYDADDFQINVPRDAGTIVGAGTNLTYAAITVSRTENANGYQLKVSVPWSALNGAGSQLGKTIGFDVAINDDRDGATRETQVMLYGGDQNYLSTSLFGDLTLTP